MERRLLLVGLLWAGCHAPDGMERSAITNGALDPGDPAVVMIVDSDGRLTCSGIVIDAHVVLTAAHCFSASSDFGDYGVVSSPGAAPWTLSDLRTDPGFDATSLANDLAVLALRDTAPVTPLLLDSRTVDDTLVGQSFTVVGFGATGGASADSGQKRSGTAKVTAVSALDFTGVADPSQPCEGDSGGPALFTDGSNSVVTGVISHGDTACMDHAVLTRVDVAQTSFIQPYLDTIVDGSSNVGERCYFDEECASGSCPIADDDPKRSFCSQPCKKSSDCPATMTCENDACRYRDPSPGALGSACAQPSDCASALCNAGRCTQSCVPTGAACPSGYTCTNTNDITFYCLPSPHASGCAMAGQGSSGWILLLLFLPALRRPVRRS